MQYTITFETYGKQLPTVIVLQDASLEAAHHFAMIGRAWFEAETVMVKDANGQVADWIQRDSTFAETTFANPALPQ